MSNFFAALALVVFGTFLGCQGLKVLIDQHQLDANTARYKSQAAAKDVRDKANCAAGVGSLVYYKGVYCKN